MTEQGPPRFDLIREVGPSFFPSLTVAPRIAHSLAGDQQFPPNPLGRLHIAVFVAADDALGDPEFLRPGGVVAAPQGDTDLGEQVNGEGAHKNSLPLRGWQGSHPAMR